MKKRSIGIALMAMVMMAPTFAMASNYDAPKDLKKSAYASEVREELTKLKTLYKSGNLTKAEYDKEYKKIAPVRKINKNNKKNKQMNRSTVWREAAQNYFDGEITFEEAKKIHESEYPDKKIDDALFEKNLKLKKEFVNGKITEKEYYEALGIDYSKYQEKLKNK